MEKKKQKQEEEACDLHFLFHSSVNNMVHLLILCVILGGGVTRAMYLLDTRLDGLH